MPRRRDEGARRGGLRAAWGDVHNHRHAARENLLNDVTCGVEQPAGSIDPDDHNLGVVRLRPADGAGDVANGYGFNCAVNLNKSGVST